MYINPPFLFHARSSHQTSPHLLTLSHHIFASISRTLVVLATNTSLSSQFPDLCFPSGCLQQPCTACTRGGDASLEPLSTVSHGSIKSMLRVPRSAARSRWISELNPKYHQTQSCGHVSRMCSTSRKAFGLVASGRAPSEAARRKNCEVSRALVAVMSGRVHAPVLVRASIEDARRALLTGLVS